MKLAQWNLANEVGNGARGLRGGRRLLISPRGLSIRTRRRRLLPWVVPSAVDVLYSADGTQLYGAAV